MAKSNLRLVTPTTVNRTVAPKRPKNADLRTREHLSSAEVESVTTPGVVRTVSVSYVKHAGYWDDVERDEAEHEVGIEDLPHDEAVDSNDV